MTQSYLEPDYQSIRQENLELLEKQGFKVAGWLLLGSPEDSTGLRPIEQIAKRLWALDAVFLYVSIPGKVIRSKTIRECIRCNDLLRHAVEEERQMLSQWRWLSRRKHVYTIGWRLENMLSLAWILGFDVAPSVDGEMLDGKPLSRMIYEFVGNLDQGFDEWLNACSPRSELEVIAKEDLFYCAHNAVRSAQLGESTLPSHFHPIANGGVIHERRHALTWAVSPGIDWDETDLST